MKKIITELHDMSRKVSNSNEDIQDMKAQVGEHQVIMRNILFNIALKRKEFNWAYTHFWIAMAVLLIFVIVCAVLLIFKKQTIVYFVSGFVGVAVVCYLIIMIIVGFVKGGK